MAPKNPENLYRALRKITPTHADELANRHDRVMAELNNGLIAYPNDDSFRNLRGYMDATALSLIDQAGRPDVLEDTRPALLDGYLETLTEAELTIGIHNEGSEIQDEVITAKSFRKIEGLLIDLRIPISMKPYIEAYMKFPKDMRVSPDQLTSFSTSVSALSDRMYSKDYLSDYFFIGIDDPVKKTSTPGCAVQEQFYAALNSLVHGDFSGANDKLAEIDAICDGLDGLINFRDELGLGKGFKIPHLDMLFQGLEPLGYDYGSGKAMLSGLRDMNPESFSQLKKLEPAEVVVFLIGMAQNLKLDDSKEGKEYVQRALEIEAACALEASIFIKDLEEANAKIKSFEEDLHEVRTKPGKWQNPDKHEAMFEDQAELYRFRAAKLELRIHLVGCRKELTLAILNEYIENATSPDFADVDKALSMKMDTVESTKAAFSKFDIETPPSLIGAIELKAAIALQEVDYDVADLFSDDKEYRKVLRKFLKTGEATPEERDLLANRLVAEYNDLNEAHTDLTGNLLSDQYEYNNDLLDKYSSIEDVPEDQRDDVGQRIASFIKVLGKEYELFARMATVYESARVLGVLDKFDDLAALKSSADSMNIVEKDVKFWAYTFLKAPKDQPGKKSYDNEGAKLSQVPLYVPVLKNAFSEHVAGTAEVFSNVLKTEEAVTISYAKLKAADHQVSEDADDGDRLLYALDTHWDVFPEGKANLEKHCEALRNGRSEIVGMFKSMISVRDQIEAETHDLVKENPALKPVLLAFATDAILSLNDVLNDDKSPFSNRSIMASERALSDFSKAYENFADDKVYNFWKMTAAMGIIVGAAVFGGMAGGWVAGKLTIGATATGEVITLASTAGTSFWGLVGTSTLVGAGATIGMAGGKLLSNKYVGTNFQKIFHWKTLLTDFAWSAGGAFVVIGAATRGVRLAKHLATSSKYGFVRRGAQSTLSTLQKVEKFANPANWFKTSGTAGKTFASKYSVEYIQEVNEEVVGMGATVATGSQPAGLFAEFGWAIAGASRGGSMIDVNVDVMGLNVKALGVKQEGADLTYDAPTAADFVAKLKGSTVAYNTDIETSIMADGTVNVSVMPKKLTIGSGEGKVMIDRVQTFKVKPSMQGLTPAGQISRITQRVGLEVDPEGNVMVDDAATALKLTFLLTQQGFTLSKTSTGVVAFKGDTSLDMTYADPEMANDIEGVLTEMAAELEMAMQDVKKAFPAMLENLQKYRSTGDISYGRKAQVQVAVMTGVLLAPLKVAQAATGADVTNFLVENIVDPVGEFVLGPMLDTSLTVLARVVGGVGAVAVDIFAVYLVGKVGFELYHRSKDLKRLATLSSNEEMSKEIDRVAKEMKAVTGTNAGDVAAQALGRKLARVYEIDFLKKKKSLKTWLESPKGMTELDRVKINDAVDRLSSLSKTMTGMLDGANTDSDFDPVEFAELKEEFTEKVNELKTVHDPKALSMVQPVIFAALKFAAALAARYILMQTIYGMSSTSGPSKPGTTTPAAPTGATNTQGGGNLGIPDAAAPQGGATGGLGIPEKVEKPVIDGAVQGGGTAGGVDKPAIAPVIKPGTVKKPFMYPKEGKVFPLNKFTATAADGTVTVYYEDLKGKRVKLEDLK